MGCRCSSPRTSIGALQFVHLRAILEPSLGNACRCRGARFPRAARMHTSPRPCTQGLRDQPLACVPPLQYAQRTQRVPTARRAGAFEREVRLPRIGVFERPAPRAALAHHLDRLCQSRVARRIGGAKMLERPQGIIVPARGKREARVRLRVRLRQAEVAQQRHSVSRRSPLRIVETLGPRAFGVLYRQQAGPQPSCSTRLRSRATARFEPCTRSARACQRIARSLPPATRRELRYWWARAASKAEHTCPSARVRT
jgi:hypothetical protein